MNKKFCAFCVAIFCFAFSTFAQVDTVRLKNISSKSVIVTDRPPQAAYFQLGGNGPILSVMYDRRFGKKVNGLGFSTGLGFWAESDITIFSVPLQLNYLFGRQNHFIEFGGGTTFVTAAESFFDTDASGFIHHLNIGYRHQPTRGGFFFRGGFSPLFFESESVTSFYLGFGHNF
jgi:hypothetical protein